MAKQQLRAFSPADAEKIAEAVRRVLGSPGRTPNPPPGQFIPPPKGIAFINDSGEEMPAGAIGAIKEYVGADNDVVYAKIEKPGTTFRRQYVVNTDIRVVADQGIGFCEFSDTYRIAHDTSWAPATGDSGGPKPGSWLLWKGYPAICNVIGRANVASDILLGTLSPITTLLCEATDTIPANDDSTDYKILAGVPGSETDAGFTTVPPAYNYFDEPLSNGDKFFLRWINNAWAVIRPAPGNSNRKFIGTLSAALASASGTASVDNIVALDGGDDPGITTVQNDFNLSGQDNAQVLIEENLSTDPVEYLLTQVAHVVQRYVTQVRYDSTSHKWQMKRQRMTVLYEEAEGDWEDILELTEQEVVENVYDNTADLRQSKVTLWVAEVEEGTSSTIVNIDECE